MHVCVYSAIPVLTARYAQGKPQPREEAFGQGNAFLGKRLLSESGVLGGWTLWQGRTVARLALGFLKRSLVTRDAGY